MKFSNNMVFNLIAGVYKKGKQLFINPYAKVGLNWLQVRKLKNTSPHGAHQMSFLDHTISFYSRDEFIHSLNEIFIQQIYKQNLSDYPYVIDCGANIGLSVLYMKRSYPEAKIIAFEPDSTNFDLLSTNVQSFDLKNVDLRKEAVWIENTTLHFSNQGSLMSKIENEPANINTVPVKSTRLKDLLNQPVDFLKIDIEGAEYEVIKDCKDCLHVAKNLFLEYHGRFDQNEELNEILQILITNGFHYYIREAIDKHPTPFVREQSPDYDVQLNIFAFK